jgi:hypothetical protein
MKSQVPNHMEDASKKFTMTMQTDLQSTLLKCISSNKQERKNAENELQQLKGTKSIGI